MGLRVIPKVKSENRKLSTCLIIYFYRSLLSILLDLHVWHDFFSIPVKIIIFWVVFFLYDNFCFLFRWRSGLKGDTDSNEVFFRDIFGDFWLICQRHSPWQVLYVLQASSSVWHWHFWRQHHSVMRKVCVTPNTENRICYAPFENIISVWLFT